MGILKQIGKAILPGAFNIIDKVVKDKDLALQLKHELSLAELNGDLVNTQAARDVIVAEAQGESWVQRSWRPVTMLVFVFIIFNNYVIAPYVEAFGGSVPVLDIPNGMWALLNVGIAGYVGGRSAEKVATIIKGKTE